METLIIGERGTVTLPADLRRRLGLKPGGVLLAEERNGELILRPAQVFPARVYTEEEVASYIAENRSDEKTAAALRKKYARKGA